MIIKGRDVVFGHVENSMYNLDVCQKSDKLNVAETKAAQNVLCSLPELGRGLDCVCPFRG